MAYCLTTTMGARRSNDRLVHITTLLFQILGDSTEEKQQMK